MSLTERTINVFEKRIAELLTLSSIDSLPKWTDADIITANCLLVEYRKLQPGQKVQKEINDA